MRQDIAFYRLKHFQCLRRAAVYRERGDLGECAYWLEASKVWRELTRARFAIARIIRRRKMRFAA